MAFLNPFKDRSIDGFSPCPLPRSNNKNLSTNIDFHNAPGVGQAARDHCEAYFYFGVP